MTNLDSNNQSEDANQNSRWEPPQTPAIVSLKDVSVGYGSKTILQNVSLRLPQGEICTLLGGSGCGKSTLFKAMVGLIPTQTGEVFLDGEPVLPLETGGSEKTLRKIGVLFQSAGLFSSMTLIENVAHPLQQQTTLGDDTIEDLASHKLSEVGLTGYEAYLPAEVSGGMRKRAGLARAMALDPKILFLDEPSAGLDPVTSARLDHLILHIKEGLGATIVIVTHELDSIFSVADRAVMLDGEERRVIAEGKPQELTQSDDERVRDFFTRSGARL